jgi:DMSO reductase anchor subunit
LYNLSENHSSYWRNLFFLLLVVNPYYKGCKILLKITTVIGVVNSYYYCWNFDPPPKVGIYITTFLVAIYITTSFMIGISRPESMILGVINEVIEATEMLNEHIMVANGCKRSIHVNTSDPLVNTTFHLRNTVKSIQQSSFPHLPQLTQKQSSPV